MNLRKLVILKKKEGVWFSLFHESELPTAITFIIATDVGLQVKVSTIQNGKPKLVSELVFFLFSNKCVNSFGTPSMTFGLSLMIRSVAPTRSSTFYPNLTTKLRNRYLKCDGGDRSLPQVLPQTTNFHIKFDR